MTSTCEGGAALVFAAKGNALATVNYRVLHLAGTGVNGGGALVCTNKITDTSGKLALKIKLEEDATIRFHDGFYAFLANEYLDLQGHDLTLAGSGTFVLRGPMKGDGDVLVKTGTTFAVRGGTFTESETYGVRMQGGSVTMMDYPFEIAQHRRPLWVEASGTLSYSDPWTHAGKMEPAWDNEVGWGGDITVNEGVTLNIQYETSDSKHLLKFEKGFKGAGKITMVWSSDKIVIYPNPAFTGEINHRYAQGLRAYAPGFMSDYAKMTYDDTYSSSYPGNVWMMTYEDAVRWTWPEAVKLANAAPWTAARFPRFAGTYTCTNAPAMPIALTPEPKLTKAIGALTEQTFVGSETEGLVDFNWNAGLAVLTGARPFTFGDVTFETRTGDKTAVGVLVTNCVVQTTTTNIFKIGNTYRGVGRLVISNAVWASELPSSYGEFETGHGGFWFGPGSQGELIFERGAIVTNKLFVGVGYPAAYVSSSGQGAVVQNGGTVDVIGSGTGHQSSVLGGGGVMGSYLLNDGCFTVHGYFMIGGYNMGNFVQRGGTAVFTNVFNGTTTIDHRIGGANGGSGNYRITGGTTQIQGGLDMRWTSLSDLSFAAISVEGADARMNVRSVICGNSTSGGRPSAIISLADGGTLRTGGISSRSCPEGDSKMWVNFDGGVFEATKSQDVFKYASDRYSPHVTIYAGGMTLATEESAVTTATPLEGATGKGVKSITFPDMTGVTTLSIPVINITGDGSGAQAMVEYDEKTHTVTGVKVVSPGCNYTCVTAEVFYTKSYDSTTVLASPQHRLTSEAGEIELADNVNSGGFTKAGTGTFTLSATNTWGGATVVKGGTLKAGCDWAIPENTEVTLAGGDLDFGGFTGVVSKVTYGAGGGAFRNAGHLVKPATFALTTSVADVAAGKTIALRGDYDLAGKTLELTGDVTTLDETTRYTVVETTDGAFTGVPTVTPALPGAWRIGVHGTRVVLKRPYGLQVIVR